MSVMKLQHIVAFKLTCLRKIAVSVLRVVQVSMPDDFFCCLRSLTYFGRCVKVLVFDG